MKTFVNKPECIVCERGKDWNPASLKGNEPFILVPSEVVLNGRYQGRTWNIFCGSCLRKILSDELAKIDYSNFIPMKTIQIFIDTKQSYGNKVKLKVL